MHLPPTGKTLSDLGYVMIIAFQRGFINGLRAQGNTVPDEPLDRPDVSSDETATMRSVRSSEMKAFPSSLNRPINTEDGAPAHAVYLWAHSGPSPSVFRWRGAAAVG
jgi:hypothetical protein